MERRPHPLAVVVIAFLLSPVLRCPARGLSIEELDSRDWHVQSVTIEGNQTYSRSTLRAELQTQPRAWYTPWRSRPLFDPIAFRDDLRRLEGFYRRHGFYEARVVYDIDAREVGSGDLLAITFWIEEKGPVTVASVDVGVKSPEELLLPEKLSIQSGQRFEEDAYQKSETELKEFFLERGYAHVEATRSAKVDLEKHAVEVRYVVTPGPDTVFDDTRIEGTKDVDPEIVRRELEWKPGERFTLEKVKDTRENLLKTDLFASARVGWETEGKPEIVPMLVKVGEKPPREIKVGVGYATDEKYRAQFAWEHHNFLGGARNLGVTLKYSAINAGVQAKFVQPHFPWHATKSIIELRQDRDEEDNYVLYASRLRPRLEHRFWKTLSGSLGYRVELDKLTEVDDATVDALGTVKEGLVLTGPSLGLIWNTTDNTLDPHRGEVVSVGGDLAVGGDFRFYQTALEAKKYFALPAELILANRLAIAFTDSIGASENLPLFERLFSGGAKSVRGFGRRRLGPRSSANDPIGGLSRIEGAVELRRLVWDGLGMALFLDFGQVTTAKFDLPVNDLQFGTGVAASYQTPVGPLRLDLGVPIERPPGDAAFQVYFSIGQFF